MKSNEFINMYWRQYILLEKEFLSTLQYLSLDVENENAFSQAYIKLMLSIGSEIDVVLKAFCREYRNGFKGKKFYEYGDYILELFPGFVTQRIDILQGRRIEVVPWKNWEKQSEKGELIPPLWWMAYNKIKHERLDIVTIGGETKEGYKFANQKYVLNALAGLYQTLVYMYYGIAKKEEERLLTPIPGSRLFVLKGEEWDKVTFYQDVAFYVNDEDGGLYYSTGEFSY